MLTMEKRDQIAEYLTENDERGRKLLDMEPAEAAAAMKADGVEITADELKEFGAEVVKSQTSGELDVTELEAVAGGGKIKDAWNRFTTWYHNAEQAAYNRGYRDGYSW